MSNKCQHIFKAPKRGLRNDYNKCRYCKISKKEALKKARTLDDLFSIVYGGVIFDAMYKPQLFDLVTKKHK